MILYKKKGKIACLKTNSRDKTTRPKLSKKKGKVNIYQDLHRTFYQSSLALAGSVLIISLILTTANMSEIKVYDNMVYFIFLGKSLGAARKPLTTWSYQYQLRLCIYNFKTAMDHALL